VAPDGESTLLHYLQALRRRKWALVAPLILLPLLVFVGSKLQAAQYEASADVLVNAQGAATTSLIGETPALEDPGRAMDTHARLARVPLVVERTLSATRDANGSIHVFLNNSAVYPLADVLRFTVTDDDADRVVALTGEYARQFVRYKRELDTAGLSRAIAQLDTELAALEADGKERSALHLRLTDKRQQLASLVTLRRSNVVVVNVPRPGDQEQIAPRPLRNTAMAAAVGLVLGLILAFLWDTLSTKPRSTWEIESMLGMPCLGRLEHAATASHAELPLLVDPGGLDTDRAYTLRANLDVASAGAGATSVMVAGVQDNASTGAVVTSLALAAARSGRRVSLVELDLRTPSFARALGVDSRAGAASVLTGDCDLADALVAVPLDGVGQVSPSDRVGSLHVLPAGSTDEHPAAILAAGDLGGVLSRLTEQSDLVVIAVPSLPGGPDAATVGAHADGLVLVVDARRARRPTLADARRAIEGWRAVPLGFVVVDEVGHERTRARWRVARSSTQTSVSRPEHVT
jgi:Mrp family chromosome partitioning ATPase